MVRGSPPKSHRALCRHTDTFDVRFHCWRRAGMANMNLNESLKQSSDVYYYDIAQRVGIDTRPWAYYLRSERYVSRPTSPLNPPGPTYRF
jgi:cell division protein FtsI/penicillin-binding protein 2